ncbi:MAG: prepilin-type N-terminal cleavage/methylation domain-containing protein, partial [Rhodoglobus sp.]|nr:prepilin-type N-terminal cleavage/methylation domain-containing protein [Rhodoglobus sp.]
MNIIRRVQARATDDSGVSITELLVTIMISGIVLAAVGTMFINIALVTNNSNRTIERNGIATNIMDSVTNVIRTASNNAIATSVDPDPALVVATANSLTIYSFVNTNPTLPAPTKVRFTFDGQG